MSKSLQIEGRLSMFKSEYNAVWFHYSWVLCLLLNTPVLSKAADAPTQLGNGAAQQQRPEFKPFTKWTVGDSWVVRVMTYATENNDTAPDDPYAVIEIARCEIAIRISGTEEVGGVPCWVLDYAAKPGTVQGTLLKSYLKYRYRSWLGKVDGLPRRANEIEDRDVWYGRIIDFPGAAVLDSSPLGYPLAMIPVGQPDAVLKRAGRYPLRLQTKTTKGRTEDELKIECRVQWYNRDNSVSKETLRVTQTWNNSDSWWSASEEIVDGKLRVRAQLIK